MMRTVYVSVVAALLLTGCAREPLPPMVYIKCPSGVSLTSKIDLGVFGDFKPGMRFAAATAQFGEPKRSWRGANGTLYQLHTAPRADVAVAKETQTSGGVFGDLPTVVWWTVYAFPPSNADPFSASDLLSSDVQTTLRGTPPPCQLVIHGSEHENGVWCQVTTDGITEIRWLNSDSKK